MLSEDAIERTEQKNIAYRGKNFIELRLVIVSFSQICSLNGYRFDPLQLLRF